MRMTAAVLALISLSVPMASFAAAPVRPAVTSYAVGGTPLNTTGARVGAQVGDQSHLAGGGAAFFIALLAAAAAGAGVYAAVHHHHNHPVSPG